MKIEKTVLENHEVKLDVTVEKEEFEPLMAKASRKIASSQRIPGFRPGKAPMSVIRNLFGETAIAQEACDLFLEEKYAKILEEAEVEPGAMGRMETLDEINPPKFSLVIPLASTVDLGDYREIREDFSEETVTDDEVKQALDSLKQQYATQEPTEDEIEDGFVVSVLIKGELDSPLEEGGDVEIVKETPYDFVVGSDKNPDAAWPYPEFTKVLLGHKTDDVVISEYTYGDDSVIAAMRGHKVTYNTTIQSVKKMVLPEENDEFAKNFGEYASFADFVDALKENLQAEKTRANENAYTNKLITKMTEGAKVEFAPAVLEEEIESRLNDIKAEVAQRGVDFATWLKMQKLEESKFIEEQVKPVALEQLKNRLVLQEFAAKEKITMDFEKYKSIADEMMAYMKPQIDAIKNKKEKNEAIQNLAQQAMNESFLSSVFARLTAIGKGEDPAIDEDAEKAENAAKAAAEAAAEIEAEKQA